MKFWHVVYKTWSPGEARAVEKKEVRRARKKGKGKK